MNFRRFKPGIVLLVMALTAVPVAVKAETANAAKKKPVTPPAGAPAGKSRATSSPWVLYAEQWDMTRSGDKLLSLPVLRKVINAWLSERSRIIEIQYPGGEEGEFWVQELIDWLVSLGIPSKQMIITPGSGGDDMIKFALRRA